MKEVEGVDLAKFKEAQLKWARETINAKYSPLDFLIASKIILADAQEFAREFKQFTREVYKS